MPQMAPMTWLLYETLFLLFLVMFLTQLFFFLKSNSWTPISYKPFKHNWKW